MVIYRIFSAVCVCTYLTYPILPYLPITNETVIVLITTCPILLVTKCKIAYNNKVVPAKLIKAYGATEAISIHLNLDIRWGQVVSSKPQLLYPSKRAPGGH
jgi:hypothetical protein